MSVSVVIPAFNAAPFLPQTLRAVAAQTRAPHEVIVVDDGSADDTVGVARAHGVRVLETGGNRGPSTARNLGIEAATAPLVAFVDADDLWEPTHLATVAGALERSPDAVLAFSRIRKFADREGGGAEDGPLVWLSPAVGEDGVAFDALPLLLEDNPVPQSTVVARRAALLDAGGYDPALRYSEDYELWCRLAARAPFVPSHLVSCRYRVHASQATASGPTAIARSSWIVRHRVLEALDRDGRVEAWRAMRDRLRRVYAAELRMAWRMADVACFDALLSVRDLAPDGQRTAQAWRVGRLALPVWVEVKSAARRVSRGSAAALA
jgi:glycosyltransferase involved in cell wall biosynthesis